MENEDIEQLLNAAISILKVLERHKSHYKSSRHVDAPLLVAELKLEAKRAGLKIGDLCGLLGVGRRAVSWWANGRNPSIEHYDAMLKLKERLASDPGTVRAEVEQRS